ncbi:putative nuclease HARBI1 isoform X2 [Pseudomyrmex gracilis]|uniref:putative nuclease HARBI1 isoform X2 n=1 Tax=Pseudomyrmex gracilis TaxID=219809 RepID=UPI00099521F2|nr:putative nuclease HARBI1 isoform X2 [Pseudomyrmex gracilis]
MQLATIKCIKAVSIAFAEKLHEYVHFPKTLEGQRNNIKKFYEIAEFPNVAACIDGTLIKIANPAKEIGEIFRSRKGSFSLNILAAVEPRGEILYIDVRHPGSTHDSTCFDRSALKLFFMENRIKGLLLGDNGYSCHSYLLTPVLRPLNQAECNYNKSHKKTRNVIERTFGRWKNKFSCLKRGLLTKLNTSIAIICATAVLWNLHIHINCPNNNILVEEVEQENAIYLDLDPPRNINGLDYRLRFIIRHFYLR